MALQRRGRTRPGEGDGSVGTTSGTWPKRLSQIRPPLVGQLPPGQSSTAESGLNPSRDADRRIVGWQSITGAKQHSSLEDLPNPYLAPPPASANHRGDRIRWRTEMKIETCQNPPVLHDGPPSPTRDPKAMQEGVSGIHSKASSLADSGQQMQVDAL